MPIMDIFKRFAPCACMRNQPVGEDAEVNETIQISVKTTCCRKTKIININITPNNIEGLQDIKEIITRVENNALKMKRISSGTL